MNNTDEHCLLLERAGRGSQEERFMHISKIESDDPTETGEHGRKAKIILAPIKVADGSNGALEFAVDLAKLWRAKLYVLYVYAPLPKICASALPQAVHSIDLERRHRLVNLFQLVDRLRDEHAEVYPLFTDNECPAESIQNIGRQLKADLVIVSSRDTNWLAKMFLYSDSDDIARRSSIPVLVYRSKARTRSRTILYDHGEALDSVSSRLTNGGTS
jgi:nucleotide-binding universal stress UspA family protein